MNKRTIELMYKDYFLGFDVVGYEMEDGHYRISVYKPKWQRGQYYTLYDPNITAATY